MAGRERFAELNPRKVDVFNSTKIPQFAPESINGLEGEGYNTFYYLTGRQMMKIFSKPAYMKQINLNDSTIACLKHSEPTKPMRVAINPDQLVIPKSNNLNVEKQKELASEFSDRKKIPGAQAVVLEASQILDLLLQHWEKTGEHLLGDRFGNLFVRSNTAIAGKSVSVGNFKEAKGEDSGVHFRIDYPIENPNIYALSAFTPAPK